MKTSKYGCITLFFFIGICAQALAQQPALAGVNLNGEMYPNNFRPSIGLTLEKQIRRHSGLETGIFYSTRKSTNIITYTDASGSQNYSFTISQSHLNIPILYKYYSKFLNVSLGPAVDAYLGWKQKDNGPVRIDDFDVDPTIRVGWLGKVAKALMITDRFVLEPEVRIGSIEAGSTVTVGVGVAGKFKL